MGKARPYNNTTPDLYHSLVCHQGVRPNTWHQNQCQQVGQCQHEVPGQLPSSDYLVLLANAWRTNPANRLPLNRIVRQLDLFIQKEQLLYEAQQLLVPRIPTTTNDNGYTNTNNNNNEQQLVQHQSFSYDDMNTKPTVARARGRHCGSSSVASVASVASCGNKRNRRFVTDTNNNNNSNAAFPTTGMNMNVSGMLRPFTMDQLNHNHKSYQQHHCDVMSAARHILSTDPISSTVHHHHHRPHQLQRSQSERLRSQSQSQSQS